MCLNCTSWTFDVFRLVSDTFRLQAQATGVNKGNVIKTYEGRLPAVLEFTVPEGSKSFTLFVNGQQYTQPLPEGDDDDH